MTFTKGHIPWNKGKKNFKIRGKNNPSKRPEVRRKISIKKKEWHKTNREKHMDGVKKMVETRKLNNSFINSEEQKEKISKTLIGIKRTKIQKKNYRKGRIRYLKDNGGISTLGKNEKRILDELEKLFNYKIIRQYSICGYLVDGYIKELNLCIEVDEPFHNKRLNEDKIRENNIIDELGCKFLRIKDKYDI